MAKSEDKIGLADSAHAQDINLLRKRLDMLDQRLDNIDSMLTVVAERVLKQSITFNLTCPNCGRDIEIALIGKEKPKT